MQLFWFGLFYNPFQMQNDKNPASAGFFTFRDEPYTAKPWMARAVFFQRSQILMDYHGKERRD